MPVCRRTGYLEFRVGIEHDVFNRSLNVLGPAGQPCHSVVMTNLLPFVTGRRHRDTGFSVREREQERGCVCALVRDSSQHYKLNPE